MPIFIFIIFSIIISIGFVFSAFVVGNQNPDPEKNSPFECGFDQYVSLDSEINFLGKEKLKKVKLDGIKKKLMGVKLDAKEISMSGSLDLKDDNSNIIGELRSACYSPHFGKVIGIAMMKKPNWEVSQSVKAEINGNICSGNVCDLPFI